MMEHVMNKPIISGSCRALGAFPRVIIVFRGSFSAFFFSLSSFAHATQS